MGVVNCFKLNLSWDERGLGGWQRTLAPNSAEHPSADSNLGSLDGTPKRKSTGKKDRVLKRSSLN